MTKQPKLLRCHICGTTQTFKGNPLAGNYCSPTCLRKAKERPDSHGIGEYGKGNMGLTRGRSEDNTDDETQSMSNIYNPFKELFDD